ncbi:MBOAT family protein [Teladorsagia circumcincta]|uniref:MBOAT family protein n=1 Tax=Teladorsagia circumcincta TaxID=45464 RepID=A0A2G9UUR3_TELCI|nr:MBOAT family protein [Teladorsagia circumcincta]
MDEGSNGRVKVYGIEMPGPHTFYDGATMLQPIATYFGVQVDRITTLAFSIHDGKVKKKEELSELQKREAITCGGVGGRVNHPLHNPQRNVVFWFLSAGGGDIEVVFEDLQEVADLGGGVVEHVLGGVSKHHSLKTALTGPVNFYSDYVAFLDGVHITPGKDGKEPSALGAAIRKLAESFVYLMIIAKFGALYPPEIIVEKEYLALPYTEWFMWWFLVIFLIRVNYYFAWIFADAVCNLSGFGFSGYDDHGNAKWELCTNVRPFQVELAQSFKETLDGWNIQTGGWLRRVAYDRTPKKIRTFATYALSALWHGISVGYYMTFFTGALMTLAGATFRRCMRYRFLDCPKQKLAYDILTFSATKVALGYTTYAFVTMNLNPAFFVYKFTMALTCSDLPKFICAVILPPLGVFFEKGCDYHLAICILLTILGYIPGIIYACYVILAY